MENLVINKQFWQNKKVLITGHTGFKGAWLSLYLQKMGATIIGLALNPSTQPNLFSLAAVADNMTSIIGDIRNYDLLKSIQIQYEPDIIFHLAAQPLVRASYFDPIETYSTNVMGTVNLLESIRNFGNKVQAVIIVTSDKCYENKEWVWSYREHDSLGGYDPYSNSKACAELVTSAFRNSFHLKVASVRAGNVIGGGDWANDRLIPDIIRSIQDQNEISIRYPHALRPWQHVLEPLTGYIQLAEKICLHPGLYEEAWNFGPNETDVKSVSWIVENTLKLWKSKLTPISLVNTSLHEANFLKLDSSKSKIRLGWEPKWTIHQALLETVDWYKAYQEGEDMQAKTLSQINKYFSGSIIHETPSHSLLAAVPI